MNKKFMGILAIAVFLVQASLAVSNEYKNSLERIELTKLDDESYSVNLYMSSKFSEPVKLIQKNDLSYYVLLPETKDNSKLITTNSDFKQVTTKSYSYAAADVNNGYVKLTIETTKPLDFNLNFKTEGGQTTLASKTKSKKPKTEPKTEPKAQEKIASNTKDAKEKLNIKPKQEPKKQEIKKETKVQEQKTQPKAEKKAESKAQPKVEAKAEAKVETKTQPKVEPKAEPKVEPKVKEEPKAQEEVKEPVQEPIEEKQVQKQDKKETKQPKTLIAKDAIKNIAINFSNFFSNIFEILLMLTVGLATFFIMLKILNRQTQNKPRLKNKAGLKGASVSSLTPKKEKAPVSVPIEKTPVKETAPAQTQIPTVIQTQAPTTAPTYVPTQAPTQIPTPIPTFVLPTQAPTQAPVRTFQPATEPVSNISSGLVIEEPVLNIEEESKAQERFTLEPTPVPTQARVQQAADEPILLSKIEIARQRGFMCISYDNNISLIGYIGDDVFVLYNFRQSSLDNSAIKFRLYDKTRTSANFLVKVDRVKLLIGVTKTSMKLLMKM